MKKEQWLILGIESTTCIAASFCEVNKDVFFDTGLMLQPVQPGLR